MGLAAHGRTPERPEIAAHGGVMETAVSALADAALAGRNPLLT